MVNKGVIWTIIVLVVLIIFIIFGFKIGASVPQRTNTCTEMYCDCKGNGEIPCNDCSVEDPIFLSGVVNVYKYCLAKEIIICEEGERKVRMDVEEGSCDYGTVFFEFVVEI